MAREKVSINIIGSLARLRFDSLGFFKFKSAQMIGIMNDGVLIKASIKLQMRILVGCGKRDRTPTSAGHGPPSA